jgi:hypothetical protein
MAPPVTLVVMWVLTRALTLRSGECFLLKCPLSSCVIFLLLNNSDNQDLYHLLSFTSMGAKKDGSKQKKRDAAEAGG